MKILKVIPITRGIFTDNLSYFTTGDVKAGALVSVTIKGKSVMALVKEAVDVKSAKSAVRHFPFQLKKIKSVKADFFINPEFLKTAENLAFYFVFSSGAIIKEMMPQKILESAADFSFKEKKKSSSRHEILFVESPKEERLKNYKSIIREEFAKNSSVFLCLPIVRELETFGRELGKGIEKYTVIFNAKTAKKSMAELWKKSLNEPHPLLIIGTPLFLFIPRNDIGTVIMENESSWQYKLRRRPYLDFRKAGEELTKNLKIRLILGDEIGSIENHYRCENGLIPTSFGVGTPTPSGVGVSSSVSRLPRINSPAEQSLISMKGNKSSLISAKLQKIIKTGQEKNERILLFINRRGHSLTTICGDCGAIITCNKCETPLVLHRHPTQAAERRFICHKCFSAVNVAKSCPSCKSWNLRSFGVGIQKTEEEIRRLFPEVNLFKLDSDTIKTKKQGDEIMEKWQKASKAILLATELLFSFLNQNVENVAVVSVDNLFALPDFRINERVFRLLLNLRKLATKNFLIQTRLNDQSLFENVIKGNISEFYQSELESRKKFNYPPFKTLIKITIERKNRKQLENDILFLKNELKEYEPFSFPAFISKIKNNYLWHILLKLDPGTWPLKQEKLHQILSSLPPIWKINVDPETLL